MNAREAIKLVTAWLDDVDLRSAPRRIDDRLMQYRDEVGREYDPPGLTPELQKVCLHEAAHAVVHQFCGGNVLRATVRRSGAGVVEREIDGEDALGAIVGMLAGPVAELLTGAGPYTRCALSLSVDILEAARMVAAMPVSLGITHNAVATLAAATVGSRWTEIDRVATSLHEKRTLSGDEIAVLCASSLH